MTEGANFDAERLDRAIESAKGLLRELMLLRAERDWRDSVTEPNPPRHQPGRNSRTMHPGVSQLVIDMLSEEPDREWPTAEVHERLYKGGHLPDSKRARTAVRTALARAVDAEEVVRVRPGVFRLERSGQTDS